jgi:hypothetical protein
MKGVMQWQNVDDYMFSEPFKYGPLISVENAICLQLNTKMRQSNTSST